MNDSHAARHSLVEQIATQIVAAHEALTRVLMTYPDALRINALILDIWSLAEEFDCAVKADRVLAQLRVRARMTCAGTIKQPRLA